MISDLMRTATTQDPNLTKPVAAIAIVASLVALCAIGSCFRFIPPSIGITSLTMTGVGTFAIAAIAIQSCRAQRQKEEPAEEEVEEPVADRATLKAYAGTRDGALHELDTENGRVRVLRPSSEETIRCLVRVNEHQVVIGDNNGKISLWDTADNTEIRVFEGHTQRIKWLSPCSDQRLLSVSIDGTACLWELENGECQKTFSPKLTDEIALTHGFEMGNGSIVLGVNHASMQRVVSAETPSQPKGSLIVWNSDTSETISIRPFKDLAPIDAYSVMYCKGASLYRRNIVEGGLEISIGRAQKDVIQLKQGMPGCCLSVDAVAVILWDTSNPTKKTGNMLRTLMPFGHSILDLAQAPSGIVVMATSSKLLVWEPTENTRLQSIKSETNIDKVSTVIF